MTPIEQIQQEIQTLNPEALNLVCQFIQILKKGSQISPHNQIYPSASAPTPSDVADWSDFIGCVSAEADLSVNYKTYLTEELEQKYGYR
ncbi:MAG: hypothetical protein VKJ64_08910 [Leptolyngbyaceae bacterium]|nr:hypothetical protein [Leptolyngbyaceae bacterium]